MVKWRADVMKVCIGLNVTDYAPKKAAVKTMMRTGPLSLFRNCLDAEATNAFNAAWEAAPPCEPANPRMESMVIAMVLKLPEWKASIM